MHGFRATPLEVRFAYGTRLTLSEFSNERDLLARLDPPIDKDIIADRAWCLFEVDGFTIDSFSDMGTRQLVELEVSVNA